VNRKHKIRFWEAREEAVFEHSRSALDALFGGLPDINESAAPAISMLREQRGRSHADRHMEIVSAGMHDRHLDILIVMRRGVARVGQFRFLEHGQRVEFCADHHDRSRTVL